MKVKVKYLDRISKEHNINTKWTELELKKLNDTLGSESVEDERANLEELRTINEIKHSRRDDKKNVWTVVIGGVSGAVSVGLTYIVIRLGQFHDEKGIINTSSISKPVSQGILKSLFKK